MLLYSQYRANQLVSTPKKNQLYLADSLNVLRGHIMPGSVALAYLDPPQLPDDGWSADSGVSRNQSPDQLRGVGAPWSASSNSFGLNHSAIEQGEVRDTVRMIAERAGSDTLLAYLSFLAARLLQVRRVLRPDGLLFLHCRSDSGYQYRLLLDSVFGSDNYRNEIIIPARFGRATRASVERLHPAVEKLLVYGTGPTAKLNRVSSESSTRANQFPHRDADGAYRMVNLEVVGRKDDTRRYSYRGVTPTVGAWRYTQERMEELDRKGQLEVRNGRLYRREYQSHDIQVDALWDDLPMNDGEGDAALRYPTRRPLSVMRRIVEIASQPQDLVIDPFCGGGSFLLAAQEMRRRWIGIDTSYQAVAISRLRLQRRFGRDAVPEVVGEPSTTQAAVALARADPNHFEWWVLSMIGAEPSSMLERHDQLADGRIVIGPRGDEEAVEVAVEVKASVPDARQVDQLLAQTGASGAKLALLVSLGGPPADLEARARSAGTVEIGGRLYPRVQLLTVEDLLSGTRPRLPAGASLVESGADEEHQHPSPRHSEQQRRRDTTRTVRAGVAANIRERIRELLLEEARLTHTEAKQRLTAVLIQSHALTPDEAEAAQNQPFSRWIERLTRRVSGSELLHFAARVRNEVVHDSDQQWPLR
jgi:site-specific DNA-methyltransferase (adenine-specific)